MPNLKNEPQATGPYRSIKRRNNMLWIIIVVLIVLWLLGFFGPVVIPTLPHFGPWVHILIVIAVILIILDLLGVI
jgi:hypothetical protein